jgi:glycosyltransferase involved in cell wall biosynthesis
MSKVFLKYIPHGINAKEFHKTTDTESALRQEGMRRKLFADRPVKFIVLYNNRNIRRKMTGDVILAFKVFYAGLTDEQKQEVGLVLHTQPVDDNGTDLFALIRDCAPEIPVVFSEARVDTKTLNDLYNISDVVINMASNEGFGLGTAEAIMAERMVIVNVTGGLQDQCGFMDEEGNYLDPDTHFNAQWGSNHDGKYRDHGPWAVPVFPNNRALIGSPPTPYIFDDRCTWEDAAKAILEVYNTPVELREKYGKMGREYMLTEGFSAEEMCDRFIEGMDAVFAQWSARERFEVIKA